MSHKKDRIYFNVDLYEGARLNLSEGEELTSDNIPDVIKVPVTRTGNFKHPWYGKLEFNRGYIDGLLSNFNKKVYPQKISGNLNHVGGRGAFAWVESDDALSVSSHTFKTPMGDQTRDFLFAEVELTKLGKEMIADKRFRYISAEIHPNYTTRELYGVGDGEAVVEHGPTLVGFAFTNTPFIPNLMSVFSEDGTEVEKEVDVWNYSEDGILGGFSSMRFASEIEDIEKDPVVNDDPVIEQDGGLEMVFSDVMKALEGKTPEQKLHILEDERKNFTGGEAVALEALASSTRDIVEAKKAAEKAEAEKAEYSARIESLQADMVERFNTNYDLRSEMLFSNLKAKGYTDESVGKLKAYTDSFDKASSLNFSEGGEVDILTVVQKVVELLPQSEKVDFSDLTQVSPEGNVDNEPVKEDKEEDTTEYPANVLKYSELNGMNPSKVHVSLYSCIDEDGVLDLNKEVN